MNPLENHDIVIDGYRFKDLDDIEDSCTYFPEFIENAIDSGVLYSAENKAAVDTYLLAAYLEYGDGNIEIPVDLRQGWYGDVFNAPYS